MAKKINSHNSCHSPKFVLARKVLANSYIIVYFYDYITGLQVTYFINHVIEDGQIVYRNFPYNPSDGIDEAVADKTRWAFDLNYYNMTGQPVGKEVPTTPGIHIHQGKKIVVR